LNDDNQDDFEQHLTEGMELGQHVLTALLDVAQAKGPIGVFHATGQLSEDQAKWGLMLLVNFERDRIEKIAKMSGINPN
jgi:hypothetical protein